MEDFIGPIISLATFIAIVAAIGYAIVSLTRRRPDFVEVDPGIGTIRRLYFYVVSFVALMMAANGLVVLGSLVLEGLFGDAPLSSAATPLALGLSLLVVGLPLWAFHWRLVTRYVRELPVETRSVVRKGHLYIVLGVALIVGVKAAIDLLQWVLGRDSFSGFSWAAVVVWGAVWAFHWRIESAEGQSSGETVAVRRLYLYFAAAGLLIVSVVGVGQIIHAVLRAGYDGLMSTPVLARRGILSAMWESLPIVVVAAPLWAAHWLLFAKRDYASTLRQLYVYLLGILGAVGSVLIALGIIIGDTLEWFIGTPRGDTVGDHFNFLPWALASIIVGAAVLVYHAKVAVAESKDAAPEALGAQKSYPYALVAIGLVTLVVGIAAIVSAAIGIIDTAGSARTLSGGDTWRNAVVVGLTLVILGLPLWGYYWRSAQQAVAAGGAEARTTLTRRAFIFAAVGAGMLALLGSVSALLFVFIRAIVDADLSEVLADAKVSASIIVPVAIFLPYYWMVYREDRRVTADAGPEEAAAPERKAVTVLVSESGAGFLHELESALGYSVSPLHWADTDASLPDLAEHEYTDLARRIGESPGENVLVIHDGSDIRVFSYR